MRTNHSPSQAYLEHKSILYLQVLLPTVEACLTQTVLKQITNYQNQAMIESQIIKILKWTIMKLNKRYGKEKICELAVVNKKWNNGNKYNLGGEIAWSLDVKSIYCSSRRIYIDIKISELVYNSYFSVRNIFIQLILEYFCHFLVCRHNSYIYKSETFNDNRKHESLPETLKGHHSTV